MMVIALGLLIAGSLIYVLVRNSLNYWKKRNVPSLAVKFPYGNVDPSLSFGLQCGKLYSQFKATGNKIHGGIYFLTTPHYMPLDTDIIKNILVKDSDHFMSRGTYTNPKQPMSQHLFSLSGEKWKFMRTKLAPNFTSSKLKTMFDIVDKCSTRMLDHVKGFVGTSVDVKDVSRRYTMDAIGSTGLGLDCNSFSENPDFIKYGFQAVHPGKLRDFMFFLSMSYPRISRALNYRSIPFRVHQFFNDIIDRVCEYRENNDASRNDLVQLLINLTNSKSEKAFTMDMVKAQVFIYVLAGYETSSSAIMFALFELTKRPDIQDKVRKEIRDVLKRYDGQYTYDGVKEMNYLSQVMKETLRMYPPFPVLNRKCTATYTEPKTGLIIEKGTNVVISAVGLHHDPEYFHNPNVFDPERFSEENKQNIQPFSYLPFGEGSMYCMGKQLGLMVSCMGLAKLLENHSFSLSNGTKQSIDFSTTFTLMPRAGVMFDVKNVC